MLPCDGEIVVNKIFYAEAILPDALTCLFISECIDWLIHWLIFNKHVSNTNTIQNTNTSYIYRKRQRGTNDFLYTSESHLGSSYVCPLGLR